MYRTNVAKWLSEETPQAGMKRREKWKANEKGKIYPLNAKFKRYQGEIRESLPRDHCKEIGKQ